MKRFDKQNRDDSKRPSSFRPRERSFSGPGRDHGYDQRPSQGSGRPFEGGGRDRPERSFESRGRNFDRPPQRFGGNNRGDDRRSGPGGGDDRRSTFRRDGGPSGGYGRPPFERREQRSFDAPQQRSAPAAAPREMPARTAAPVPLARLKNGVRDANRALAEVVEQFGHTLEGGYDISALEVTVSFADDGRFLGFGKGGAASMTLSITPVDSESLLEGEEESDMELDDDDFSAPATDEGEFEDEDNVDDTAIMSENDATEASKGDSDDHESAARSASMRAGSANDSAPQPTFDA